MCIFTLKVCFWVFSGVEEDGKERGGLGRGKHFAYLQVQNSKFGELKNITSYNIVLEGF